MTTACNRKQSWQTKLHQDSWGAFRSCFDILLLISSLLCYLPHKEKHEIMEQAGTSLWLGQPLYYMYYTQLFLHYFPIFSLLCNTIIICIGLIVRGHACFLLINCVIKKYVTQFNPFYSHSYQPRGQHVPAWLFAQVVGVKWTRYV